MRLSALSILLAGCLGSFDLAQQTAFDDAGIDVGEVPTVMDPFGPDDAGIVPQADLAPTTPTVVRYHPVGYAASTMHGPEMKLQKQDCRTCHGSDLSGGSSNISCDSCHSTGWRQTCNFCHGTDMTGLPPRDISGETDPTKISFPAHAKHAAGNISNPFGCTQCHRPNLDVMSNLHVFDTTPGRAEVLMAGGLSATGTYDATTKTCSSNYCHGNGQTTGTIAFDAAPRTCHSCHADITTSTLWGTMSGDHSRHLRISGITCVDCHNGVVATDPLTITDKTRHLDGKKNIQFSTTAAGITYNATTRRCTGSCHGKSHSDTW